MLNSGWYPRYLARTRPIPNLLVTASRISQFVRFHFWDSFRIWVSSSRSLAVFPPQIEHLGTRGVLALVLVAGNGRTTSHICRSRLCAWGLTSLGLLPLFKASWPAPLAAGLTIHSSRHRFAARLNSGVSAAQRLLAQQSGSRFGMTSGQIADQSSLAALAFSLSASSDSAVLRSALMASSRLALRGGANNSFKPTPLRGAA